MKKLPALPKLFFLFTFLLSFALLGLYFNSQANAAIIPGIPEYDLGVGEYYEKVNEEIINPAAGGGAGFDDKAFNLNQLGATVDSLNYILAGHSEFHQEVNDLAQGGLMGGMGNLISQLYIPPASSVQYLAYLKENLGLTSPAYAQQTGIGFGGLTYLLPIWKAFRNAAYLVFIILFVITGLLIMFRVRVSPQAVATIQNMLPRLVITLILITLSYAIAGLMIDLMYVIIYLIFAIIENGGVNLGALKTTFQNYNVFQYWSLGQSLGWENINKAAEGLSKTVEQIAGNTFVIAGTLSIAARSVGTVIFTIAILWALFRLFFILLKAYVWVLVLVIFAPFQLLLGALPGGGGALGVSGWIRGLVANLAVFPTTIAMFSLASAFITLGKTTPVTQQWAAPLIGTPTIDALMSLIAMGLLLLTPTVAQMMNDAFKPPPFPYGVAIGQALGVGPAVAGGGARRIISAATPAPEAGKRQWGRILTG